MRSSRKDNGERFTAMTAALVLTTFLNSGCGSHTEYPSTLSFPSRTDRLVLKLPEAVPATLNEPGQLVEELARLDSLGGKTTDPITLSIDLRTRLDQFLREAFGTPAAPTIGQDTEASASAARLKLTNESLVEGGKLFRRHCLQCHNLTGDGRGPAGLWVVPYPRDFRRGMFKFTTTDSGKPRHRDLVRTLNEGLKGTAMPAFEKLPEAERELLARHVAYLAIRGQVEFDTLAALLSAEPPADLVAFATNRLRAILAEWEQAENAPAPRGVAPGADDGSPSSPTHADAVRRGYALFTAKADNACIACHTEFGRKPVLRFDVWGTVAKAANLTEKNIFKGGKQPESIFARIRGGIPAVGMPAHPDFTDRQVWDLVRFVQSLPYPRELPDDIRAIMYPNP